MQLNSWEEIYKEMQNIWGIEEEDLLRIYEPIIKNGKVLDLGIGEGRNSLKFALKECEITGVDISQTALERCHDLFSKTPCAFKLFNEKIPSFKIEKETYTLIISSWALNFMKKSQAKKVIENALEGLVSGGIFYMGVFSTEDPQYKKLAKTCSEVERDTFFIQERKAIKTFFTMEDLLDLFDKRYEIICKKQDLSLDIGHGQEHYHGAIELLIRKK